MTDRTQPPRSGRRARRFLLPALVLAPLVLLAASVEPAKPTARLIATQDATGRQLVELRVPTGDLSISVHGWGIYQPWQPYVLALPARPHGRTEHPAAELQLFEDGQSTPTTEHPVELTAGKILVDPESMRLTLDLQTPDGPFHGNDTYQLWFE